MFENIILFIFIVITVYLFYKANTKKYNKFRQKEAERYFEGSIVDKDKKYEERTHSIGLTLCKDKKSDKYTFKKQAKISDTALLYKE